MSAKSIAVLIAVASLIVLPTVVLAAEETSIAPGDTIKITVLGEPEQSKQVVVDAEGNVALPLIKDVKVAGMTTGQAAAEIATQLSKWIKNPDVTVEMVQKVRRQVTIAGQVKTPGVYPIDSDIRVMEVVGLAGGFSENADPSKVRITRRGAPAPIDTNMQEFLAGKNEAANLVLQEGDVILVPEKSPALGSVFVFGSVKQPGQAIQLRDGMRVSHAISAAGGIVPEQADLTRVELKHQGDPQAVKIDVAKAMAGDATADIALAAGDTINIPMQEQVGTFTILGAVAKSGEFPIKGPMTVSKAIAAAGTTSRAKLSDVKLTRAAPLGMKPQLIKVDVQKIAVGKGTDVALQPGDTIYVPEAGQKTDWMRILGLGLGAAAILVGG